MVQYQWLKSVLYKRLYIRATKYEQINEQKNAFYFISNYANSIEIRSFCAIIKSHKMTIF